MKLKSGIGTQTLLGGIFAFNGAIFAAVGILMYFFGDSSNVEGSFDDPEKNFIALCAMFTIMGLIFFFVGMGFVITEVRKIMRTRALVRDGYKIYAVITGVREDTSVQINNHYQQYAICEYEDPYTLEKQTFNSMSFNTYLSSAIGSTVAVYLDQSDHSRYYVDLDPESIVVKY